MKPLPASDLGNTFTCSAVPRLRGAAEHLAKVARLAAPSTRTEVPTARTLGPDDENLGTASFDRFTTVAFNESASG